MVHHANDVAAAVGVGTRQQAEHADFVESLASKPFLAADDLQRHPAACLVIKRADYLPETAAAEHFEHFIAARTSSTHR